MIEYQDGTHSEMGDFEEIFDRFGKELRDKEEKNPTALHVGTREELEEKKEGSDLEERVGELEDRLDNATSPRGSHRVAVPSPEDVVSFSEQNVIT